MGQRCFAPARVLIAILMLCSLSLGGCRDTLNVGRGDFINYGPSINAFTVSPADPAGLFGGESATFSASFHSGTAPYTISIDFGGAASPNLDWTPATSPFSSTVALVDLQRAQDFTATFRVTDALGFTANPRTLTFNVGATRNKPPVLTLAVAGNIVSASITDPDSSEVTVTLDSVSSGLSGRPASQRIEGGNGSADFSFSAVEILAGAVGTATFTADDRDGGTDTETSGTITVQPVVLPDDGLAAIPLATEASTEDSVKVVIASGPMANPFQFMTGVSIIFPPGCSYSGNSYDYGAPVRDDSGLNPVEDKDQETVDGIWTLVNPVSGFLGVGDNLLVPDTDLPAPFEGMSAIDFNITPLNGTDAPAGSSGILFNFDLEFSAAGTYKLGFLLFDEINRTYYQDGQQAVYQWGDLSNATTQDTVTVTE